MRVVLEFGRKPLLSHMHKVGSFIKCRHYKSVHGEVGLLTLESIEVSPTVHPRYYFTRVVVLKRRRLQVGWIL